MFPRLLQHLGDLLDQQAGSRSALIMRPNIGTRVPDLLIGEWDPERLPKLHPRMGPIEAHVLAVVSRYGVVTPDQVHKELHMTSSGAIRAFARLKSYGALIEKNTGEYRRPSGSRESAIWLTAIEVKLRRWREALSQAAAYRRFANRAFVVLDSAQVKMSEEMLKAFKSAKVGLVLLSGSGLDVVVPAVSQRRISAERIRVVHRIFGSRTLTQSPLAPRHVVRASNHTR
jgi:hypothetical protein